MMENGLVDIDKRLRIYSCNSDCARDTNWFDRIVAVYASTLGRPVAIEISQDGQFHLAVHLEGLGADVATLTWLGCSEDCMGSGAWTDAVALETVETDLNSLPDLSLTTNSVGAPALISFDEADQTTLTLHQCASGCSQQVNWIMRNINEEILVEGGLFDAGYGVDARYAGNALELVFAAKAADSPLRQLVVASRCEQDCALATGKWASQVLASTDEELADQGICIFIGTRVSSSLSAVRDAVGFTASPQWACGVEPLLVTGPDTEQSYDYAGDIRYFQLSTVVAN